MNAMKAMVVGVGLLLAATPAGAMTGQSSCKCRTACMATEARLML
jgi:hypothetical protein